MSLVCCHPCRSLAVLGAAVLLAGLALCQPSDKPKKVALLVGINKYDKRGFAEHPLPYAERDADEMAVELKKAGFEVRLLKGSSRGDDRALRANLDKALEAVLKGRNADDLILVGLAGHGLQMDVKGPDGKSRQEAFFCPADAVPDEPASMLSMTELIDKLNRKGGRNLVLVDACRNDPTPGRGGRGIDGDTVEKLPLNTAILFSCSKGQRAWESAQAGGGHGIFFHFLLEGLRGGAKGADGQVTWGRLTEYVKNEVTPERVKALQPGAVGDDPQTPHEVANLRGRSPVLVDLGKEGDTNLGKAERKPDHTAVTSSERKDKGSVGRHERFLAIAKKGDVDVLFLGDSITQGWETNGKEAWKKNFEPLKAANFGIGGDQTQHVLWRITKGKELEGLTPKVAVLMIGTNNTGAHSAEQIADGITAIVAELRKQKPQMHVLLLGVFPRSQQPTSMVRDKIKDVNKIIAKLDDGKKVHYRDIGEKFLEKDGSLSKEIMSDFLHLSPMGYEIWAKAIKAQVERLLKS
jgi:lysophospholipase L1-like esterase